LSRGLEVDHYHRIELETEKFFTTLTMVRQPDGDHGLLVGDPWRGEDVETMRKMGSIYRAQHEATLLSYRRYALIVTANSLDLNTDPDQSLPDLVEQQLVFEPTDRTIFCHRLTVGSKTATDFPGRLSCTVRNVRNEEHRSDVVPCLRAQDGEAQSGIEREILVFFEPPLEPGPDPDAPYTLLMRDLLRGGLADLEQTGFDELGAKVTRAAVAVPQIDLVMFVPESHPGVEMARLERPGASSHPGRPMTPPELSFYNPPYGFRPVGWTGRDVPPKAYLGTQLIALQGGLGDMRLLDRTGSERYPRISSRKGREIPWRSSRTYKPAADDWSASPSV
jgi:hypothetical protein